MCIVLYYYMHDTCMFVVSDTDMYVCMYVCMYGMLCGMLCTELQIIVSLANIISEVVYSLLIASYMIRSSLNHCIVFYC